MLKTFGRFFLAFGLLLLILAYFVINDWYFSNHSNSSVREYTLTLEVGEGTSEMIGALEKIKRYKQESYLRGWSRRLREYKSMLLGAQNRSDEKLLISKANRELRLGFTEKALKTLNEMKPYYVEINKNAERERQFFSLMAIANMRLGEQQNCANNPHASVCILPLREEAIHKLRQGSSNAIDLYENYLLANDPDDYESKWLLNVAYMTLGEYPQGVPVEHLLTLPGEVENYKSTAFKNVADLLNVAEVSMSGASVIADFNGDDLLDIFTSSWTVDGRMKLYFRQRDGRFSDVTEAAGLAGFSGGLNAVQADYNNDGFIDIYVNRGAWPRTNGYLPNSLLRNNGDGTFTDVTVEAGLLNFNSTLSSVFSDLNNDGWLDLVVANESQVRSKTLNPSNLFLSNQDGTFTDVAEVSGFAIHCAAKGIAAGDYDNDGRQDLYVSCLDRHNYLYNNQLDSLTGKVKLVEVEQEKADKGYQDRTFATWFWDFDNDGNEDIFVAGYGSSQSSSTHNVAQSYAGLEVDSALPRLYQNNGSGEFNDQSKAFGLNKPIYAMGANFGDIDNDGWLDMYLGTGEPNYKSIYPNVALQNIDGKKFQDVSSSSGLAHIQKGHGVAFADLDHDGDQDIYIEMGGAYSGDAFQNALFENNSATNQWVTLILVGVQSNQSAIGSRIKVEIRNNKGERRSIYRTVNSGGSFGASTLRQEIGLGDASQVERITVSWPASGITQVFTDIELNQFYRIYEDSKVPEKLTLPLLTLRPKGAKPIHKHHH